MASRRDYYFRQLVAEAELDAGFEALEAADRALMVDMGVFGVLAGMGVAENGAPNLTVNIGGPGVAYDQLGQRINLTTTQNKDISVDDGNTTTTVAAPGNEKWVSVFAKFARTLSDPRVDGNSNTVYFVRDESFSFSVVQGAEAVIGLAARPALISDGVLLADINRTNGVTTILNAAISTTRRQDYIAVTGTPRSLARGRVKDAFSDLLGLYNSHVLGAQDRHFDITTVQPVIQATSTVNGVAGVTGSLFWETNSPGLGAGIVVNGTELEIGPLALTAGDVVLLLLDGTLNMEQMNTKDIYIRIVDEADVLLNACWVARQATWAGGGQEHPPFAVHATYAAGGTVSKTFRVQAIITDAGAGAAVMNVKFTALTLRFA